ncbi:MAG: flagellar hook-basal body complex protein FliE [Bacteroidetes bacterium]|nr:flagellar hook-basal body complex protein FliE [Bacteroidota bacterium]MCL5738234.1 flagellar hook-basal body complex protein FliE [Bacteroidota bacterium]
MRVGDIQSALNQMSPDISTNKSADDVTKSFESTLNDFVHNVNDLQSSANTAIDKMASGQAADVHEVMVAVEKAKVSFDLLLEIRNKMLDAYRQIMQMQM